MGSFILTLNPGLGGLPGSSMEQQNGQKTLFKSLYDNVVCMNEHTS